MIVAKDGHEGLRMKMENLTQQKRTSPLTVAEAEKLWFEGYQWMNIVYLLSIHLKSECKLIYQIYRT
jgi:hypothetical protein